MCLYTCARVIRRTSPPPKKIISGWLGQAQKKLREALRLKFGKKGKGLSTEDPDREYKDEDDESDNASHGKGGRGRGRARGRGRGKGGGRGRGRSKEAKLRKPPQLGLEVLMTSLKSLHRGGGLEVLEEKAKAAEAKVYQDMAETAGEKHEGKDEAEVGTPTKKKPKNRRTGTPKRTARKRATPKRKAQASPKKAKKRGKRGW